MAETNMLMLLNRYNEWADQIETSLFNWVDPDEGWKLHPYQHYPLANFASVFAMCMGYLAFVLIGSWIMKNDRIPAFNTSMIQFFYNPLQIIVCSYMCIEAALQAYRNILDLMDTFFIIAGKKFRQLSILHVYHHISVLFVFYVDFRVAFDGDIYPTIVLNGFIHTIMYTYYFVSAHTKQIWWKKYLTTMQLVQFLAMNIQGSMIVAKKCTNFPPKIAIFYLIYVQSLFWLFMNFYIRAYVFSTKTNNKDKTLDRKLQGGASGAGIIQKEKLNKKIN